jgi:hypothetical protein
MSGYQKLTKLGTPMAKAANTAKNQDNFSHFSHFSGGVRENGDFSPMVHNPTCPGTGLRVLSGIGWVCPTCQRGYIVPEYTIT